MSNKTMVTTENDAPVYNGETIYRAVKDLDSIENQVASARCRCANVARAGRGNYARLMSDLMNAPFASNAFKKELGIQHKDHGHWTYIHRNDWE